MASDKKKTECYEVNVCFSAFNDLSGLDTSIYEKIDKKVKWLALNSSHIIHHQLTSLPDDLKGLCKIRVGDWRILYWVSHERRKIWIFRIQHRSKVYKNLI